MTVHPENKINREHFHRYSIAPIVFFLRLVCLDRKGPSEWWRKIQCLIYVISMTYLAVYTVEKSSKIIFAEWTPVTTAIDTSFYIAAGISNIFFIFCGAFLTHDKYSTKDKRIVKIDSMLNIDSFSFYQHLRGKCLLLIFYVTMIYISACLYDFYSHYKNYDLEGALIMIPIYALALPTTYSLLNLIINLYFVWVRLLVINHYMTAYYPSLRNPYRVNKTTFSEKIGNHLFGLNKIEEKASEFTKSREKNLDNFISAYKISCETAEIIGDVYSLQILIISLMSLLYVVKSLRIAALYGSAEIVTKENNLDTLLVNIVTAGYAIFAVMGIIYFCNNIDVETQKTTELLDTLLLSKNIDSRRKLKAWSNLAVTIKPRFTACGLFPVDYTLLFTLAGSVATFLIMLMQNT